VGLWRTRVVLQGSQRTPWRSLLNGTVVVHSSRRWPLRLVSEQALSGASRAHWGPI